MNSLSCDCTQQLLWKFRMECFACQAMCLRTSTYSGSPCWRLRPCFARWLSYEDSGRIGQQRLVSSTVAASSLLFLSGIHSYISWCRCLVAKGSLFFSDFATTSSIGAAYLTCLLVWVIAPVSLLPHSKHTPQTLHLTPSSLCRSAS